MRSLGGCKGGDRAPQGRYEIKGHGLREPPKLWAGIQGQRNHSQFPNQAPGVWEFRVKDCLIRSSTGGVNLRHLSLCSGYKGQ